MRWTSPGTCTRGSSALHTNLRTPSRNAMADSVKPRRDEPTSDRRGQASSTHHSVDESEGADLEPDEKQKAKEEESLSAAITHEVIRREGQKALERPMS